MDINTDNITLNTLETKIKKINKLWEIYSFHTGHFDKLLIKTKDFKSNIFVKVGQDIQILSVNWNNFELAINNLFERLMNADEIIINYSWKNETERYFDKEERIFKYNLNINDFEQIRWKEEKIWLTTKVYSSIQDISEKVLKILVR